MQNCQECDERMVENVPNSLITQIKLNAFTNDRTIYITGEVDDDTSIIVNRMMDQLVKANRDKITIIIDTPGGSVFSALSIIGKIEQLRDDGIIVEGISGGMCMSAGLFIYMCCSTRLSQRYTRFLLHELRMSNFGYSSVENVKRNYKDLDDIWDLLKRLTKKYTLIDDELLGKISDNDLNYYFFPEKAVELGLTDRII